MSHKIIFITGGARSGKSSFAISQAKKLESPITFLATAQAFDLEMTERIERHQLERVGLGWYLREEPIELQKVLLETNKTVLLDCLSLWVSNMLLAEKSEQAMFEQLNAVLEIQKTRDQTLLVVSNEVGSGVVPEYPLGRTYRDWLGRANQIVAQAADEAYLLVAGLPLKLK
jgi:adenosylcobinamide kinase / adenosylcobinamide-phosphate guanylyltransferase